MGQYGVTPRGRVVMLVDNSVLGDSRVQKTAGSAAAAGWDVTLLGMMTKPGPTTWRIGDAEVRLVKVPRHLAHHRRRRRAPLRRPLAYRPGGIVTTRIAAINAWKKDIQTRRAVMTLAQPDGGDPPGLVARVQLELAWFVARAVGRWARFRAGQLDKLQASRGSGDSLLVTVPMRFWQWALKERAWRRLDASLWDYELAFGAVIDELQPDLIHANDCRMLGVGARAALRARVAGRPVKLVYDAHEYVPGIVGRPADARWLPAQIAYEKEFIRYADAVVTVSPTLAEMLQEEHDLPERPSVVLNAPPRELPADPASEPVPDIRELCGIGPNVPLLTYCGGVNQARGIHIMIEALPQLPGVHVAMVVIHPTGKNPHHTLSKMAEALGLTDRVHLLPYVPHSQVPRFLAPADAAVIAMHHGPNHEIALPSKFFEYSLAGLPLVVSDVRTVAETVRRTGRGEVFCAGDLDDYVWAVRLVLRDQERYRAAYDGPGQLDGWTWEAQAEVLDEVYGKLVPPTVA